MDVLSVINWACITCGGTMHMCCCGLVKFHPIASLEWQFSEIESWNVPMFCYSWSRIIYIVVNQYFHYIELRKKVDWRTNFVFENLWNYYIPNLNKIW
jgi:hypothetical protein